MKLAGGQTLGNKVSPRWPVSQGAYLRLHRKSSCCSVAVLCNFDRGETTMANAPKMDKKLAETLKGVLMQIDPEAQMSFLPDGRVRMSEVERLMGTPDITREQVDAVWPGFTRETAKEARVAADTEAANEKAEAEAAEAQEAEDAPKDAVTGEAINPAAGPMSWAVHAGVDEVDPGDPMVQCVVALEQRTYALEGMNGTRKPFCPPVAKPKKGK